MCFRDIEKYFHGAHLTITARDEDEIDEEQILEKVSKVSATAYNFKEKQTFGDEAPVGPVGSNHKKINPKAELPSKNIHNAWTMKMISNYIGPCGQLKGIQDKNSVAYFRLNNFWLLFADDFQASDMSCKK